MCNCQTHVRTLEETNGGRFPPSQHAPTCEDYKLEIFGRIHANGSSMIVEESMVPEALEAADDEDAWAEPVQMTRDQYEALPEHQGF